MAEPDATEAPSATPAASPNGRTPRRRRWLVVAAVVVALIAGLAGGVVYGPQLIARYVVSRVLTGLDIDVEGVKTLRINLLAGKITLGPVRFRSLGEPATTPGEKPGQLGRLGVTLSLNSLWQRNALISSATIEGVDLVIARESDGKILINGIPLSRILAEKAAEPPPETEKPGWGTGVDYLTLKDSHLVFHDADRGTLTIAVSWLELTGFRSWEPDEPGTFTLVGDANGIQVIAWGQAEPFADNVRLNVELTIDGIAVPKIETLTGPFPLTARGGTGTIDLRGRGALFADGRVEAAVTGYVQASGVDLAGSGWSVKSSKSRLDLDLSFAGASYDTGHLSGGADLSLAEADTGMGGGVGVKVGEVNLNLGDLGFDRAADGGLTGAVTLATAAKTLSFSDAGGLVVRASTLNLATRPVTIALAADGSSRFAGDADLTAADMGADLGKDRSVGAAEVKLGLADFGLNLAADGGLDGRAVLTAMAKAPSVTGADGLDVRAASLDVTTQPMSVTLGADAKMRLAAAPKIELADVHVKGPLEGSAADLGLALSDVVIDSGHGTTRIKGTAKGSLGNPHIAVIAAGASGSSGEAIRIDAHALGLDAAPITVALASNGVGVDGNAGLHLDGLHLVVPKAAGGPADIDLSRLGITVDRAAARIGDGGDELDGNLSVSFAGGAARLGMIHRDARAGFGTFDLALAPLSVRADAKGWQAKGKGRLDLEKATAKLPQSGVGPLDSDLGAFAVTLSSAEATGRGEALNWQLRAGADLRDIVAKVADGRIADVSVDHLAIDDVNADQRLHIAAGQVGLGAVRASLARSPSASAPKPVVAASKFVAETQKAIVRADVERRGGVTFKLDRFHLEQPSQVRLNDPTIDPPLQAALVVRRLDVDNLDTDDTKAKTDITLDATINEFGNVTASGWITPFADPLQFDLRAQLRGVQLPPFSGYAADAVGVNIDSGRLGAKADAKTASGQLSGQLNITLSDLAFGELSEEQAARASAAIGVPIDTAIGLLKDPDGKITLSLPVSGDLNSPSFDLSGVIGKALTGAVTSAMMAPFKLAFAPVSLIAGAIGSSGAPALAPVPFTAGSAELDVKAKGIVDGLRHVLTERPELALKVCGRAVPADLNAAMVALPDRSQLSTDELLKRGKQAAQRLAEDRTLVVRRALLDGGAIKRRQVGECRASFDAADTGPPRTEITF